jgi:hypothetical protein
MWHHHLPNRKDILHARVRQASISRQGQRKMAWRRVCDVFRVRLNADRYKVCKIISVNIFSAFQSCSILDMSQFIPWNLMLAELWRLLVSFLPTQKLRHIQSHNRHSNLKRQMVSVSSCNCTATGSVPCERQVLRLHIHWPPSSCVASRATCLLKTTQQTRTWSDVLPWYLVVFSQLIPT